MIDAWLDGLTPLMGQYAWFVPFLALAAGILTSFTPCSLPNLPLVVGCVSTCAGDKPGKAFRYSLMFVLGTSVALTVLGTVASLLGQYLFRGGSLWYIALGILMVFMGLHLLGVITLFPRTCSVRKKRGFGYPKVFLAGIIGGFASSPCATPVLIVLLAVAAQGENPVWGALLLFLYSIGFGLLPVLVGTSVGTIHSLSFLERFQKAQRLLQPILGILILLLAFYLFYLGF